eukprot:SAG31_NODE_4410_length_3255_cov_1.558935_2_plen_64_part_00
MLEDSQALILRANLLAKDFLSRPLPPKDEFGSISALHGMGLHACEFFNCMLHPVCGNAKEAPS